MRGRKPVRRLGTRALTKLHELMGQASAETIRAYLNRTRGVRGEHARPRSDTAAILSQPCNARRTRQQDGRI